MIAGPRGRSLVTALGFALVVGWILLAKLLAYERLGTTSDLYSAYQLATTWLDGNFLYENAFGHHLSMHTYFLTPLLAVVAVPFGPAGLLGLVAFSAGATYIAAARILERLTSNFWVSRVAALVLLACPLSFHLYFDSLYGFHVELLAPALALWLLHFLLQGRIAASLLMALLLVAMKEEIPLLVAVVAGVAFCEATFTRVAGGDPGKRRAIQRAALWSLGLAVVGFVASMIVLEVQDRIGPSWGSFERLVETRGEGIRSTSSLAGFVGANLGAWVTYTLDSGWPLLVLFGSFGTIFFRPHYAFLGFGLGVTAWLMRDDILWPARLAPTWSFLLCVSVIGAGSAYRYAVGLAAAKGRILGVSCAICAVAVVTISLAWQWQTVRASQQAYILTIWSPYTPNDRAEADRVFGLYEAQRSPNAPVITAPFLFRYADPDSIFWADQLEQAPPIEWILWDKEFDFGSHRHLERADFNAVRQSGKFHLYQRRGAG